MFIPNTNQHLHGYRDYAINLLKKAYTREITRITKNWKKTLVYKQGGYREKCRGNLVAFNYVGICGEFE